MKWITLLARLLIGSLFIYASIYKIFDPSAFAASIRNYGLIPPIYSNLIALTLPWLELGCRRVSNSWNSDQGSCIANLINDVDFSGGDNLRLCGRTGY